MTNQIETPREAVLAGLRVVSELLEPDGFQFHSARPRFTRRHGDLSYEIYVQSDRNNASGARAAIWVHACVVSRSYASWQRQHPSDWIRPKTSAALPAYGGQIGNLEEPYRWMEWNFVRPTKRSHVALDLVGAIRRLVLPVFSDFETVQGAASRCTKSLFPIDWALGYIISQGCGDLADRTLDAYLSQKGRWRGEFEARRQNFIEHGLPQHRAHILHDLAAFAAATGYPWASLTNAAKPN